MLDLFCESPKAGGWGLVEPLKYTSSVGKLPSFFIFTPTTIRGNHLDELRYSKQWEEKDINILHTRWTVEFGEIGILTKWHSMMIICFKGTTAQIKLEFFHTKLLEAGRGEIGPLGSVRAELLVRKLCSLFLYPASPLPCPRCKLFAPWSNSRISFRFSQVFPRTFGGFLGNAFFPDFQLPQLIH